MAAWGYREYTPVSVRKARTERAAARLRKKNPQLAPIQITGRKLAKTWWGMAWNDNLERYADYSNRIERGRSYVRQGAVLDLSIEPGLIHALVQGSRVSPYQVTISIQPLRQEAWQAAVQSCSGSIHTLEDLMAGRFPKSLSDLFTARGNGLFPTPKEISLSCTCPDWADLCKHVAAALYGVGARLDEDPSLFFVLRQVQMEDLISDALQQTSDRLLDKTRQSSRRVLEHQDLAGLFGINVTLQTPDVMAPQASRARSGVRRSVQTGRPDVQPSGQTGASTTDPSAAADPVRRRGRPPKATGPAAVQSATPGTTPSTAPRTAPKAAPDIAAAPARRRGRPPKAAEPAAVPPTTPGTEPKATPDIAADPVKRRGRPPKADQTRNVAKVSRARKTAGIERRR